MVENDQNYSKEQVADLAIFIPNKAHIPHQGGELHTLCIYWQKKKCSTLYHKNLIIIISDIAQEGKISF